MTEPTNPATFVPLPNLVAYVRTYAEAHYEDGGWDVLVECWDRDEIANLLREHGAETREEALAVFRPLVSVWADRQADARNSEF